MEREWIGSSSLGFLALEKSSYFSFYLKFVYPPCSYKVPSFYNSPPHTICCFVSVILPNHYHGPQSTLLSELECSIPPRLYLQGDNIKSSFTMRVCNIQPPALPSCEWDSVSANWNCTASRAILLWISLSLLSQPACGRVPGRAAAGIWLHCLRLIEARYSI